MSVQSSFRGTELTAMRFDRWLNDRDRQVQEIAVLLRWGLDVDLYWRLENGFEPQRNKGHVMVNDLEITDGECCPLTCRDVCSTCRLTGLLQWLQSKNVAFQGGHINDKPFSRIALEGMVDLPRFAHIVTHCQFSQLFPRRCGSTQPTAPASLGSWTVAGSTGERSYFLSATCFSHRM